MRARFWWPLAVAVSVMVWLVPATARAQATRTVTGMVVDGAGDGVVGATVVLDGDPAVTTQSVDGGGFVLAKVPVGDVLLRLTAPGFDPVAVPLKAGKAAVTLSVSMTRQRVEPPPTRMLTGLVRDDAGAICGVQAVGPDEAIVADRYTYPGLGSYIYSAAIFGDPNAVEAAAMLLVIIAVATRLIGDAAYMLLNPRIRYS